VVRHLLLVRVLLVVVLASVASADKNGLARADACLHRGIGSSLNNLSMMRH
jgi:hypothetical protein